MMVEIEEFVNLVSIGNESLDLEARYVRYSMLNLYCQLELDRLRTLYSVPSLQEVSDSISLSEEEICWLSSSNLNRDEFVRFLFKILTSDYFSQIKGDVRRIDSPISRKQCNHFRCKESNNLEKDHIVPFSILKVSAAWNAQWLCRRHNQLKGNRIEFYALSDEIFRNGLKDFLRQA